MANNTSDNYIPLGGAFTLRFTPITLNGGSFNPLTQGSGFVLCLGQTNSTTFAKKDSNTHSGNFTITSTGVAVYIEPAIITASGNGQAGTYYTALYVYPTGSSNPITHLEKTIRIMDQIPLN